MKMKLNFRIKSSISLKNTDAQNLQKPYQYNFKFDLSFCNTLLINN